MSILELSDLIAELYYCIILYLKLNLILLNVSFTANLNFGLLHNHCFKNIVVAIQSYKIVPLTSSTVIK